MTKVKAVATEMTSVHLELFAAWVAAPLLLDILEVFGTQQTAVVRTDVLSNIPVKMVW